GMPGLGLLRGRGVDFAVDGAVHGAVVGGHGAVVRRARLLRHRGRRDGGAGGQPVVDPDLRPRAGAVVGDDERVGDLLAGLHVTRRDGLADGEVGDVVVVVVRVVGRGLGR